MNKELDEYFKEHKYIVYNSANDTDSFYDDSEERHEYAIYESDKLDKIICETHYYEKKLVRIDKMSYFGKDEHFFYIISVTRYSQVYGNGHSNYEMTLPHNQELTVEYLESLLKIMNIKYD